MNVPSLLLFLAIGSSNAWVLPSPKFIQGAVAAVGIAGAITLAPLAADAESSVFNHQYNDPNHPNCKRLVTVKEDGKSFLAGTDGNPGCPEDGSGNIWRLQGETYGNTILVDFGPKGGPANVKGVWEAKDTPGIRWPDGNKWTVKN
mmetsp:Transcript_15512/g.20201  ORF Transcript_15512/g.20201 Transcript_15512/m.20201 type:complete len:146 (+) Transcript_15512:129-566(+)|eukprot:CAMPEP_0198143190 /NCGR_PEP_ID=MMETSP1443-20131203/5976_1 /TAXON_ID=186043 /ORGANISM="Entomoneis sp., Strain CCMP2396" /LENGTH=145 /DNA_ID=CAMNT_0043806373 /DNA_START=82 /DNA_END=519 /DNA_ORIENTATION=-